MASRSGSGNPIITSLLPARLFHLRQILASICTPYYSSCFPVYAPPPPKVPIGCQDTFLEFCAYFLSLGFFLLLLGTISSVVHLAVNYLKCRCVRRSVYVGEEGGVFRHSARKDAKHQMASDITDFCCPKMSRL